MRDASPVAAGREGAVLFMVLVVMLVLTTLALGMMSLSNTNALEAATEYNHTRAFWLAEAGLNELKAIVYHENNRRSLGVYGLVSDGDDDPVLSRAFDGYGAYEVFVREANASERAAGIDFMVESVGTSEGASNPVSVFSAVRLTTVSELVWNTHTEGSVRFVTGDQIWGPAKSNGEFNISGTPKIYGYAETAASTVNYYNNNTDEDEADPDVFLGGLTFGVAETDFDSSLIDEMAGESGMETIDGDCAVEFLADGRFVLSTEETSTEQVWVDGYRFWFWWIPGHWESQTMTTTTSTTNYISNIGDAGNDDNIIYVDGTVKVSGEVGGSVSVVSTETIKVVDDLVYASTVGLDDDISRWPSDFEPDDGESLGLYAKEKVEIDYDQPTTGRGRNTTGRDINLHAAVFCAEAPNGVDNPGFGAADRYTSLGEPYINLFGSIVQHSRGVIGSGNRGYMKNYHHDERFQFAPPPGSPMGDPEFSDWRVGP